MPFAPFGIATVSRQVPPALYEFLYALSASQGADPTRGTTRHRRPDAPPRNGEPYGELGLVTQKDHGLWQDQTGGPTDPQPGNIPGGRRDVLRSADFNDGNDVAASPSTAASGRSPAGSCRVAAASLGQDAAAVFYTTQYLPVYYEITAHGQVAEADRRLEGQRLRHLRLLLADRLQVRRHRRLDQQDRDGPPDAARAGSIDAQTPRAAQGRHLLRDAGRGQRHHRDGRRRAASPSRYTFAPGCIDGVTYGLNKGMVGFGSDNARGTFDNIAVQVLPPQITLDHRGNFDDGVADLFTGEQRGTWQARRTYIGSPPPAAISFSQADVGRKLSSSSYLELTTTVRAPAAAASSSTATPRPTTSSWPSTSPGRVLIGHIDTARGLRDRSSVARTLVANTDYSLQLVLKGLTLSVTVNGAFVTSLGFNGVVVDGAFGLAVRGGTSTFDTFRVRTNDPAFPVGPNGQPSTMPLASTASSFATAIKAPQQTTISSSSTGPPGQQTGLGP